MAREPEDLIEEEEYEPVGQVRIIYLGPVAPHWLIEGVYGDAALVDEFRHRAMARLIMVPPHDPQFRRNRERVNRDAERARLICDWDLGYDEEEVEASTLGDKPSEPLAPPPAGEPPPQA